MVTPVNLIASNPIQSNPKHFREPRLVDDTHDCAGTYNDGLVTSRCVQTCLALRQAFFEREQVLCREGAVDFVCKEYLVVTINAIVPSTGLGVLPTIDRWLEIDPLEITISISPSLASYPVAPEDEDCELATRRARIPIERRKCAGCS